MSDIKVRGPKGCAKTLSFSGESYSVDKRGLFTVPYEAWEQLQRHGFVVDGADDEAASAVDPADQVAAEVTAAVEAVEAEKAAAAGSAQS